ncbi:hypothetical protein PENSUB_8569 [Penicillium subrubescens]|uniref:Uncharacterized protein n=2 Tax=Penicillium subrubescens TaxID=1316194 RepID=A0A1Q5TG34_9EURO|nr:hypothetical protein PENSUB_8569 [Penicillium subrubescens]
MIYEHLLVAPWPLDVDEWVSRDFQNRTWGLVDPAIVRTNRQIFHESINTLYSKNEFSVMLARFPEKVGRFLENIGSNNAAQVRKMGIYYPGGVLQPLPIDFPDTENYLNLKDHPVPVGTAA